ncbi:MAG: hypothetical protein KIT83_16255 [Bryobacterales bacterium]|nr:hypothetical protein [Bryobacterales bacterium]
MSFGITQLPGWRRLRRAATWFALLLVLLLAVPDDLWARRGGRISVGRSGGGFSTRTYSPPPSRAKTWGGTAPSTISPRMGTRSASRPAPSSAPRRNSVDQATMNRARTQGTTFGSRAEAERAFERDYATKFPSTFSREPGQRPNYIPPTTTVEGQNYDVSYNSRYGGYGYMRNGTWVAYNVFRDMALLNMLMSQNSYVYGQRARQAEQSEQGTGTGGEPRERSAFGLGGGSGLVILLMIIGVAAMIPRNRGGYRPVHGNPPGQGRLIATLPGKPTGGARLNNDFNFYSTEFWRSLKPGSTVILKDEQTLQDMISGGEALATGRDYQVAEVWRVRESRDVAEWQFFRIRSPHDEDATWLMVKSAGDDLSAGVYFEADGFQPGNRRDILNQNHFWVFNEPRDQNSYQLLDLQFASHLYFNMDLEGDVREVEFTKMGNLEFYGKVLADPPVRDGERMVGTVAEYETMLPVPNSKVVFFEAGLPGAEGGLIRMLQGADIRMADLEVLPLGSNS